MSEQPATYLTTAGALGRVVRRHYQSELVNQIQQQLVGTEKSFRELYEVLSWDADTLGRHLTMMERTGQIVAYRNYYKARCPGPMYRGFYWTYQLAPGR